jgi:peptidoglycan/xylan/chitin deacetylase (PgdA/CDA1 family)
MGMSLYLTFDDGPAESTAAVLDALERHGAKATFFQQGGCVVERPDLTLRAWKDGHAIGNHAWSHPDLEQVDEARVKAELSDTSDELERVTGRRPSLFRPPYGRPFVTHSEGSPALAARRELIRRHAADLGMGVVLWHTHADDWTTDERTAADIATRVIQEAGPEQVVLLHDDLPRTAEAVPTILRVLADRGYAFAALPPGTTLIPGGIVRTAETTSIIEGDDSRFP